MFKWRPHRLVVLMASVLALAGCSSQTPLPSSSQCASKANGALCIKVIANGPAVGDVIGYVSYSGTFLTGKTWQLVLASYSCDPGQRSQPACRATATYPGQVHHGPGPADTYCKDANGATVTTPPGCHDVLWSEFATLGNWSGFHKFVNNRPWIVPSHTWLCITERVQIGGHWQLVTSTTPTRDCSHVA